MAICIFGPTDPLLDWPEAAYFLVATLENGSEGEYPLCGECAQVAEKMIEAGVPIFTRDHRSLPTIVRESLESM